MPATCQSLMSQSAEGCFELGAAHRDSANCTRLHIVDKNHY